MARYSRTNIIKSTEGKRFYDAKIYPEIPRSNNDLYVITAFGDRYDLLANRYYKNPSLWWVISSANPEYIGSLYPPIGVQLRIPADISIATQI